MSLGLEAMLTLSMVAWGFTQPFIDRDPSMADRPLAPIGNEEVAGTPAPTPEQPYMGQP
jgi:hypothetical protein